MATQWLFCCSSNMLRLEGAQAVASSLVHLQLLASLN
eukprot:CAMPEP_0113683376 /NCGR_PEP_ID=MMETSP0038_2-20120614/13260_1 /TAXON_ID=2898 /ORGANISM="Cryptomonas paramecium" /LENGTH=36 /DNA_ID=CAMNT_0000602701 /DNA_START=181 /DNA_END=288 /DNA_ORIENTATION=+ /assembly_acc=CAM_ASM_000170